MSPARQRGFTLLEMLVATLVLTLLVSLVYGMVRMATRSWESGTARIEAADAMRIGWTFLQRSLNNARAVPNQREDGAGGHFFGTAEALEFVADMPAYLGSGGRYALGIGLAPDPQSERPQLLLRRIPLGDYRDAGADPEQLQQAVLAEDVAALELSYYGSLEADQGPDWHSEWLEHPDLPILVRVQVALRDGSHWPVLIAHPRLGMGRQEEELPPDATDTDGELPEPDELPQEAAGAD